MGSFLVGAGKAKRAKRSAGSGGGVGRAKGVVTGVSRCWRADGRASQSARAIARVVEGSGAASGKCFAMADAIRRAAGWC